MTDAEIASLCFVTLRTAQQWRRFGYPPMAARLIAYRDGSHPEWPGFQFLSGELITPNGDRLSAREIESLPWFQASLFREAQRNTELETSIAATKRIALAANEPCHAFDVVQLLNSGMKKST
ncbi:MAG: hypothetical protein CSB44_03720 [Gammaproteobacteria bacterium]|nr:MAG: hypothetical protein CSB44_03720 [Gammaproteobacteria bacterium]